VDEALAHFQEALRLKPDFAHALCGLGELALQGWHQFTDEEKARLSALLVRDNLKLRDWISCHFLQAALLDRQGCYDQAFEHYRQANKLRRHFSHERGMAFDAEHHELEIDGLIKVFSAEYFQQIEGFGLKTDLPVFIVGMPRSGTTLVEQILASHPLVFGAGELQDIKQIAAASCRTPKSTDHSIARISLDASRSLAGQHLQRLADLGGRAQRA
jgi:tetratricopeptide (TPR) repeat protein